MKIFDYKFKNKNLHCICFTHPSYKKNKEFQRLEFLGDKVLSLYLSDILFHKFPNLNEGDLTIALSNMVNQKILSHKIKPLIKKFKFKSQINDSILSDCFEVWIGAIFLDGANIYDVLWNIFQQELNNMLVIKDPKNLLQEITQKYNSSPIYQYTFNTINKTFSCQVTVNNQSEKGIGNSKKTSSQDAASKLLAKIINKS